jgi:hypothetical protein
MISDRDKSKHETGTGYIAHLGDGAPALRFFRLSRDPLDLARRIFFCTSSRGSFERRGGAEALRSISAPMPPLSWVDAKTAQ